MTNRYYGSQLSDNFSDGYNDALSSSESLTNRFTMNAGRTSYTHSSIPPSPDSAQFHYSQFGQAHHAAIPVPQQQMMGYGAVPSGALPYSKDKVIAAVLCWFLGGFVILLWPLVNFIQILTSTGIYRFDFPRT